MIQQVTNKTAGKVFIFSFVLLLLNASISTASAQLNNSNPVNLHVKYVGDNYGQPVYSIQFDNNDKQVQSLFIKDVDGTELYSENVNATWYSKKFQLNLPDFGVSGVVVTLIDASGRQNNYMVNHKVTTSDDIEVTKL